MKHWTKKGQEATNLSLGTIIQIVLLITVVVAFFSYVNRVKDNSVFEQSYASRDIALLLEATQGVPGDVVLYYSQPTFDVGKYSYSFTDNLLRIYEENPTTALYYPFFVDQFLENQLTTFEHPAAFVISKEKNTLHVQRFGDITIEKTNDIPCPAVASTNFEKLSLVVLASEELLEPIQKYFIENAKVDFPSQKKSTAESSITEETSLVLVLVLEEGSTVHAFVPLQDIQSEKLGCFMTNSLGREFPSAILDDVTISDATILNTNVGELAVEMHIGKELLDDPALVSAALQNALEEYYDE